MSFHVGKVYKIVPWIRHVNRQTKNSSHNFPHFHQKNTQIPTDVQTAGTAGPIRHIRGFPRRGSLVGRSHIGSLEVDGLLRRTSGLEVVDGWLAQPV